MHHATRITRPLRIILDELNTGEKTTAELQRAFLDRGTMNSHIATRVSELRQMGHDIACRYVEFRNGCKVYAYKLEEK